MEDDAKVAAVSRAKEILAGRPLFLDTETTGLDQGAEVVDIAVVDLDGRVVLNELVRPCKPIPVAASAVHGIRDADVAGAPSFAELWSRLREALAGQTVVIYNRDFDVRMLEQSARACGITDRLPMTAHCAMVLYAQYWGDWSDYFEDYRWQRLEEAARQQGVRVEATHRALADAELTRRLMLAMVENG
jgi:DNA polymerase-3 subunit epsilon